VSDIKLKSSTTDLAASIKPLIKAEGTNTTQDESAYDNFLKENDSSIETVKRLQKLDTQFVSACMLAHGEVGIEHMAAHPEVQSVTGVVQMGHNKVTFNINRSKDVSAGPGTDRVPVLGYPDRPQIKLEGGGEQRKIREHLKGIGIEMLTAPSK
jgi:hypothetical protein